MKTFPSELSGIKKKKKWDEITGDDQNQIRKKNCLQHNCMQRRKKSKTTKKVSLSGKLAQKFCHCCSKSNDLCQASRIDKQNFLPLIVSKNFDAVRDAFPKNDFVQNKGVH